MATENGYDIDTFLTHVFRHAASGRGKYDPRNCPGCSGIRSALKDMAHRMPTPGAALRAPTIPFVLDETLPPDVAVLEQDGREVARITGLTTADVGTALGEREVKDG